VSVMIFVEPRVANVVSHDRNYTPPFSASLELSGCIR
jgi:hypothetical protein